MSEHLLRVGSTTAQAEVAAAPVVLYERTMPVGPDAWIRVVVGQVARHVSLEVRVHTGEGEVTCVIPGDRLAELVSALCRAGTAIGVRP